MAQFYLQFQCGARYPKDGFLKDSFQKQAAAADGKPRKKDGRFDLCVWQYPGHSNGQPYMPDDSRAPCAFCKNTRINGRKKVRCFPQDKERMATLQDSHHAPDDMWDWTVTCFPEEIAVEDESSKS